MTAEGVYVGGGRVGDGNWVAFIYGLILSYAHPSLFMI